MEIKFYGAKSYLPGENRDEIRSLSQWGVEPLFWVAHSPSDPRTFYDKNKPVLSKCIQSGGAILFVSGSAFGGLTPIEAENLQIETDGRVHCLSVACSGRASKLVDRLKRFLLLIESLAPGANIPWEKADPPVWPESLVAVYLILKAIDYSPTDANAIRSAWETMNSQWQQQVWSDAWSEYQERGLSEHDWLAVGLPDPTSSPVSLPSAEVIAQATDLLKRALSVDR